MTIRTLATLLLLAAASAAAPTPSRGQAAPPVRLVVNADQGRYTISRHVYGQFMEHLGHGIYDGVWTKDAAGQWHFRDDVVAALKKIRVPNVRWPGGCFADKYHWRDGVGPRAQRPSIVNTNWGNVTEDNSFGTHEYMELMQRLGAEPFIVGNVGSGSVQEMSDWWDYLNFPGASPMADLRRKNGREAPWNVRFWGVGNEPWGCGGNMRPEYYADVYKRYASFLSPYGATTPFRIAAGGYADNPRWTEVLMRDAGSMIDGIDLHYYTIVNNWTVKGSATGFGEKEWFKALKEAGRADETLTRHSTIMDQYDPQKRVALILGEWGIWHDVEPGTNPGFLFQQNTLRDAFVASVTLDILNRHADRVRMANIAQMINVLQAMILTRGDSMLLTPTYHVYEMYVPHQDATLLPVDGAAGAGSYRLGDDSIPAISASASRDREGRIHVTMSNLDPNRAQTVELELRGARASTVTGRILTAGAMNAHNTFAQPDIVKPAPFGGARVSGSTLTVQLPPKSIVALELR